jgi:hypothetical protein
VEEEAEGLLGQGCHFAIFTAGTRAIGQMSAPSLRKKGGAGQETVGAIKVSELHFQGRQSRVFGASPLMAHPHLAFNYNPLPYMLQYLLLPTPPAAQSTQAPSAYHHGWACSASTQGYDPLNYHLPLAPKVEPG